MRMFITISTVIAAALMLVFGNQLLNKVGLQVHQNPFVNNLIKFQLYALIIGLITAFVFIKLNPTSISYLGVGKWSAIAVKEKWLGINGTSTWFKNGLQLLIVVSLATSIFMFLGVKYTNSINNFQWWFVPFILLFSITNAFSEELIFRFAVVAGLVNQYPKTYILIISSTLFGLPHFFGNPGGIIGVIMSAMLGYILCKLTIETKGIVMAWLIHLVQDVIIFTALMMMNIQK